MAIHPARPGATRPARQRGRRWLLLVLVAVLVALTGCQADLHVDTTVQEDGSGAVTVSLGLDPAALARLGDPDQTVEVADLRAAGWEIPPAEQAADGTTWLRATKRFADADQAAAVMAELNPAVFRDFRLQRDSSLGQTTWTWTGTVDLTKGIAAFGDPEAAAVLGGDPFGGRVAEVEQAEGKPVAQMVDITVSAQLPAAERKQWTPRLGDAQPTVVQAASTKTFGLPLPAGQGVGSLFVVGAVVVLAVVAVVVVRRRTRRPRPTA